jgi:5-methylcytosine-specific restriction endonuclease McrA
MSEVELARQRYNQWKVKGEGRAYLAILFSMCEGICPVCGKQMYLCYGDDTKLPRDSRATFDHIEPLKYLKRHEKTNLMICCYSCNHGSMDKRNLWNATLRAGNALPPLYTESQRKHPSFVNQGLPSSKNKSNL